MISAIALSSGDVVVLGMMPSSTKLHQMVSPPPPALPPIEVSSACPRSLPHLTQWMLQDLPSYSNRVLQRHWSTLQRQRNHQWQLSNMLLAGQAEFEALPPDLFSASQAQLSPTVHQLFFTTLSRSYWSGKSPHTQLSNSYHWLFLNQTPQGWEFVQMITRLGKGLSSQTALPPRDSSDGAIAQAIRLWLRDCQAGRLTSQPPQAKSAPTP